MHRWRGFFGVSAREESNVEVGGSAAHPGFRYLRKLVIACVVLIQGVFLIFTLGIVRWHLTNVLQGPGTLVVLLIVVAPAVVAIAVTALECLVLVRSRSILLDVMSLATALLALVAILSLYGDF
jgi:hypothetical protein